MEKELADSKKYLKFIYVISVAIPLVVAFLIFFPAKLSITGDWVMLLPGFHAIINSLTVLVLLAITCLYLCTCGFGDYNIVKNIKDDQNGASHKNKKA